MKEKLKKAIGLLESVSEEVEIIITKNEERVDLIGASCISFNLKRALNILNHVNSISERIF